MKILVTGAAGFIGSYVAQLLANKGAEVTAIDNLNDYYSPSLKELRIENFLRETNFINIDIANREDVERIFKNSNFDVVLNLAAQAGVRLEPQDFHKYTDSNLVGFQNIISHSVANGVKNFIYASSSSVYGNSSKTPYSELDKELSPISYYGATKLSNEQSAHAITRNTNTKSRGLRLFTVYGPWGRPDMAYFRIAKSLILDQNFKLYGDGTLRRDFTYVDDASQSILLLIENLTETNDRISDVVNVGGGNVYAINQLIDVLNEISKKKLSVTRRPQVNTDVLQTSADGSYLEQLTGKIPSTKLEKGLLSTYKWMSEEVDPEKLRLWT
ncbi:MAG: SDR family NAD(P)-dependent oxidoreductase [Bacteroidetes bacterium]|nr:SDR family NAD(P)-dependent oxidoreductase [bacterium]NBP66184.1 SDR family NAD(P)-dependent oxidoreductase [Bacteroidota bacterium]